MSTLSFEPAGQDSAPARIEAHKLGKFLPGLGVYGFDDFEIAIGHLEEPSIFGLTAARGV